MQSTTHQPPARPVMVHLKRPLTVDELKAVAERGFEPELPQKPVWSASLCEADLTWFKQQEYVGKVSYLPRNDAELRAMAAVIASQ